MRGMMPLDDLPSQVKLVIYQLIPSKDRSSTKEVFPSFQEIAQQLELGTAGAGAAPVTEPKMKKRRAGGAPLSEKQQSVCDAARLAAAEAERDRIGAGDEPELVLDTEGVCRDKDTSKWRAQMSVDGRKLLLKTSESKAVCVAARKAAVAARSAFEASPVAASTNKRKASAQVDISSELGANKALAPFCCQSVKRW